MSNAKIPDDAYPGIFPNKDGTPPDSLNPSSDFYNDHVDEMEMAGLQSMTFKGYKYGWSSPTTKEGKGLWVRSEKIED